MRILQFAKLICTEELQACSLKNCSVVIDGQNFLHDMYENSKIPFVFGSETNEYAKYLRRQFRMFKQANVKCYIVLKGGDTDIEEKFKKLTKSKKFRQLIFEFDTNCDFVLPVFVKDATAQVIDEMGIDNAYCVTENKDDCVALAQKLGCPLISFDGEFCFRKAPYIPSTTMKFNTATNSIQCGQYKLQDFLRKHSLTEEKTAIFATLSDSTIFPQDFFDSLLKTWGVSNDNLFIQLKNLILWLSEHSEQEAKDEISKAVSEDDRTKFWLNYQKILNNMRKDEAGHVTDYLINSKLTIVRQDPEWFEKGVISKHVSQAYVNLYKRKVIEGAWAIEDKTSQEDSLILSIDIIIYAYNLLTDYRNDTIKVYQDADSYVQIDTRDPKVRKPFYNCKVSVFENGWDQVKRLKLFEHFLNENKISTVVLAKLPPEAVVLFIALVYFARKKQLEGVDVTKEVYAVLLSYVMLNYVFDKEGSYKKIKNHLSEKDCLQATRGTTKYFKYVADEAKLIFDGNALKRFVEFQYCLVHMNHLNVLCGSPYKTAWYSRMYHGTFVFKLFCDMQEKDSKVYVNKLFEDAPSVLAFVKKLLQVYHELLVKE